MRYRDLLSKLPSDKTVVVAGNFNPPCNHHQLLIQGAKKLAENLRASLVVYLCPGGLLSEDHQETYFKAAFPGVPYSRVVSTQLQESRLYAVGDTLEVYNLKEEVEIEKTVSIMTVEAASGNYHKFKTYLPIGMKDVDARRLMNDIRESLGYPSIVSTPTKNPLRDSYLRGDKYKVGELVESAGEVFTITRRGTNYVECKDEVGNTVTKWLHEIAERRVQIH